MGGGLVVVGWGKKLCRWVLFIIYTRKHGTQKTVACVMVLDPPVQSRVQWRYDDLGLGTITLYG